MVVRNIERGIYEDENIWAKRGKGNKNRDRLRTKIMRTTLR